MDGIVHNRLFVYHNNHNGTFAPAVTYVLGFSVDPSDLMAQSGGFAVGDVTGDGIPDVVAIAATMLTSDWEAVPIQVLTLPGRGDGTFGPGFAGPPVRFTTTVTVSLSHVQLADTDKDGDLDLVFLGSGADYVNYLYGVFLQVAKNDGTGHFTGIPADMTATGAFLADKTVSDMGGLHLADINDDGQLDALFSLGFRELYLAVGAEDGTFTGAAPILDSLDIAGITNFADVTGDGNLDVVAYYSGAIAVYAGTDEGEFSPTPIFKFGSVGGGDQQPMPADFDGDGRIDLVHVDQSTNRAGFYLGREDGFHGSPALMREGQFNQDFSVTGKGDFNGDGIVDIIARDNPPYWTPVPGIAVGVNNGEGKFTYLSALSDSDMYNHGATAAQNMAVDLNGDGKDDILVPTRWGVSVSYNNGDGTFQPLSPIPFFASEDEYLNCAPAYFDIGDLNGDGRPDIVSAYPGDMKCNSYYPTRGSGVFSLINNGDGTFTSRFMEYGNIFYLPKLIDFNGDGILDLAVADNDGNNLLFGFYIFRGVGDGTFSTENSVQPYRDALITAIVPGDFDADGKQDLTLSVYAKVSPDGYAIYNSTGIALLKGNGDFTFGVPTLYAVGSDVWDGRYTDLNGDGRPDLSLAIASHELYPEVVVSGFAYLLNKGTSGFGPLTENFTTPTGNSALAISDFNGDGATDVVLGGEFGSQLFINGGAIRLTLAASATTMPQGSSVEVTATASPVNNQRQPSGNVVFYDNGEQIDSVAITGGSATLGFSTNETGTHVITATYSGDDHFNAGAFIPSASIQVTAADPAIELGAPSAANLTIVQGNRGSVTLPVTANATFAGTVQLTCSGAPELSTCTVSPASVDLTAGQSATVTVSVATTFQGRLAAAVRNSNFWMGAGGTVLAFGLLFLTPFRSRKAAVRRMGWMMALVLAGSFLLTMVGCGGNGGDRDPNIRPNDPSTPTGTSTLTITATSGSLVQTRTFTVTVTAR